MSGTLTLTVPHGYSHSTQATIGFVAASMDEQLAGLLKAIEGFETRHFEWQQRPGMNTVGMLVAHIAVAEVYWLAVAAEGLNWQTHGDTVVRSLLGIGMDDDGFPLGPEGTHPDALRGKDRAFYTDLLQKARAGAHARLRTWADDDLETLVPLQRRTISKGWMLYHVLEHFSGHYGQVLLLRHLMRDAGLIEAKPAE
jgi:uncharacterized damage-inducible protein DinB